MSHTPGPWKADLNPYAATIWAGNMRICDLRGWGYLTGVGGLHLPPEDAANIQDANARLISAAPELLEACRYMHKLLADMGHGGLAGAVLGENAIAKAEGRS